MTEDHRLSKIEILLHQNNYSEAGKILTELLSEDPNNPYILSYLAEVSLQQGKVEDANRFIDTAIGIAPEESQLFYIKARISIDESKLKEAEDFILQALHLDPNDAQYYALLGHIKMIRKQYQEALELANKALEIDAENIFALNTRSTALNKLNRKEESFETVEGALREDPNNAYTHANYGWGLLEQGNHKKALEHFKESLSNDPTFEYAQAGILEALKAKNPIYRLYLKYAFFIGNLSEKYQWGVILGFYFGMKGLNALAKYNEALQPFLTPLILVLAIIAFSTWIITPLGNLFLRFNKYGRMLLDKKEKLSSSLVAISLLIFTIGLVSYLLSDDERMLTLVAFGFGMMPALGAMFAPTKVKNALVYYTFALALVGSLAIAQAFSTGVVFNNMSMLFLVGFILFQWVANYFLIKEDNY